MVAQSHKVKDKGSVYLLALVFVFLAGGIVAIGSIYYQSQMQWWTVFLMSVLFFGAVASAGLIWRQERIRFYKERSKETELLSASETRYRRLFETAKDGILILDAETGVVVDVNPFLVDMLDLAPDSFLGKKIWELESFKDIAPTQNSFVQLLRKEFVRYDGVPLKAANGRRIEVEFVSSVSEVDNQKVIQCNIREVTERKLVAEAVRESEARFRLLFEQATDGILLAELETRRFVLANRQIQKLLGYSEDELLRLTVSDIHPADDLPRVSAAFEKLARYETTMASDIPVKRKDGTVFFADISSAPIRLQQRDCVFGIFRDVTGRKRAEEALRRNETQIHAILESTADGILAVDSQGKVIKTNQRFADLWRIPQSLMEGADDKALLDFVVDQLADPDAFLKKVQALHKSDADDIDTISFKDGRIFERYSSAMTMEGRAIGRVWSFRDITRRRLAAEAIQESEERFRLLFEHATDGMLLVDVETKCFFLTNRQMQKLLGYSEDELLRLTVSDIHPADDLSRIVDLFEKQARREITMAYDIPIKRKDGTVFFTDISATPVRLQQRDCLLGIFRDITERKRAEQDLEQAFQRQQGISRLHESLLEPQPLRDKLQLVTETIVHLFDADFCRIWLTQPGDLCAQGCMHAVPTEGPHVCRQRETCLHLLASAGRYTHLDGAGHRRVPYGAYKIGRIAAGEEAKFLINNVQEDPRVHDHEWAKKLGLVSFAGYRLQSPKSAPLGVLALFAKRPLTAQEDVLLEGLSNVVASVLLTHLAEDETWRELAERKRMEEALRESETELRVILESTADGILAVDSLGKVIKANQRFADLWRVPHSLMETGDDKALLDFVLDQLTDPDAFLKKVQTLYKTEAIDMDTLTFKDGRVLDRYSSPMTMEGKVIGRVWSFSDVTEQKQLQHKLLQSQKTEAVGRLTGGIAHEFNNLLTAILGYTNLLLGRVPSDSSLHRDLEQVEKAGNRAATLTRQLLSFSRRQMQELKPVNLNTIVLDMQRMLQPILGSTIRLTTPLDPALGIVIADPAQIEQVIMNMAVNARDAMPHGGELTIATANVCVDDDMARQHPETAPGSYVRLTVGDTGVGMSDEVKARLFDPFFTTKAVGQGTGLGLSTCIGIVKQTGGFIDVDSTPGKGTTFHVFLPQAAADAVTAFTAGAPQPPNQ